MSEPSKQSKGGTERAKRLTKDQRTEIARAASGARWGLPVATHEGELRVGNLELPCAVLEDGRRMFAESPLLLRLALADDPPEERIQRLEPLVSGLLGQRPELIKFRNNRGAVSRGVRAELLPRLCEIWLDARKQDAVKEDEMAAADAAEALIRSFSLLGVIATVDEASGYLYEWLRNALVKQLAPLVHEGLAFCAREFTPDYFKEMCRLRGVTFRADMQLPDDFGPLTVDVVFSRLQPEAINELKDSLARGATKKQVGAGLGQAALLQHLGLIGGLMRISTDWQTFLKHLDTVAPVVSNTETLNN